MAKQKTAKIPFSRVVKIGIYSNQAKKAKLSTIYTELKKKYPGKEVYISNCGFFTMTSSWRACFGLKADGQVLASNWAMPFVGINGKNIQYCKGNSSVAEFTDAVSAFPPLVEHGGRSPSFSHCLDNSNRGRTMLGFNDKEIILSVIADTSGSSDFTLDEEVNYMIAQKADFAINLDGGGSSQCNFNGSVITSSRKVHNLFYIIAEPAVAPSKPVEPEGEISYDNLEIGQVVYLKDNAKYSNGISIPKWVINSVLYVRGKKSDNRIVISTRKTGPITGTVNVNQLRGAIAKPTLPPPIPPANAGRFYIGQEVRLLEDAVYISGQSIPQWVKDSKVLYVRAINANGVIFSTVRKGAITGIVDPKYLIAI